MSVTSKVRRDALLAIVASLFFVGLSSGCLFGGRQAFGQDAPAPLAPPIETEEEIRERETTEKFLQLLKRRPRLGTALDKVYGYHVSRGTLDSLVESLSSEAEQSDDGNLWLVLGMIQMQRGQDAAASVALDSAEKRLPEEPLASYYLGKTLLLIGDVERASEAMQRALSKKPPRPDALQIMQDLGRILQRTGRAEEALKTWSQLEELFPNDIGVQIQIASILAEEGAEEEALTRYERLAKSTKDRFQQMEMAIQAAQLKTKLGRTEEALRDFETQLTIVNPDSWLHRDIRRRIEEVFWATGDFDGLIEYYSKWIQSHPDDIDAMTRAARALSIQKRSAEARDWFRKAIERAPSNVEYRKALVDSLAADREFSKAVEEMKQLLAIEPDDPDAIVRCGELIMNDESRPASDRRKEASDVWRKLLEKNPDDPVNVSRLADLLRGADLTEESIAQYRQAIELAPNEPQYREYLGEYLHRIRRADQAIEVWSQIASDDRRTRDNLVRLSEVFSTFKLDERALETMAEACTMKPAFAHLARYGELLREARKFDEAIEQIQRAEEIAEDREQRELIITEQIKTYQARGDLAEQIAMLEERVAGDAASDGDAWRLLALMRDANRLFQGACDAIEKACELAGDDPLFWETAASLYERTGRFGEAIHAFRKLATLDRRFLSNYLTQIASLEMRLGNVDEAMKAGEELLAATPGNSESFRFFSGLCFQAGQNERGLEVLRRNVRSNPNDQDAIMHLAKTLSDNFQTDEAIELYWRAFDLASDVESRSPIIEALAQLYLRTNRFDILLTRLETTSREKNQLREGTLWLAAAQQAAGDLGSARQLLEQLVREESRDTALLEQLVSLARSEYDFEAAADYQERLVAISPSPEREYLLATLLTELGELDQAELLWMKMSTRGQGSKNILTSIESLMSKGENELAGKLLDRALEEQPDNWELLVPAMFLAYSESDKSKALKLADEVLAKTIDPAEPTEKVRELLAKRANQTPSANAYDPYADLGRPMRLINSLRSITSALPGGQNVSYIMGGRAPRTYTPSCFGDVRTVALAIQVLSIPNAKDRTDWVKKETDAALASDDSEQKWRALSLQLVLSPTLAYSNSGSDADKTLEALLKQLIDQRDADAAAIMLSRFMNERINGQEGVEIKPLTDNELERLDTMKELVATLSIYRNEAYFEFWIIDELRRSGKNEEAEKRLDKFLKQNNDPMLLMQSAIFAISRLQRQTGDKELDRQTIQSVLPALRAATEKLWETSQTISGMNFQQVMPLVVEHGGMESGLDLLDLALRSQAHRSARLRPSQRDQVQTGTPASYYTIVGGVYNSQNVEFPPVSGYFDATAITELHSLVEAAKQQNKLGEVQVAVERWAQEETDDIFLKYARLMAKLSLQTWNEQSAGIATTLEELNSLELANQSLVLIRARLLYQLGQTGEALAELEKLRPTNQQTLVDRELAVLQLVLELGDLDRARQSAQRLFALRLDSETEFKLAEVMSQLGMQDLASQVRSRLQRRGGGQRDTLQKLMTSYKSAGEIEKAAEIARQILRRSQPAGAPNMRNEYDTALKVLVEAKKLAPLIEQYEKLVERSPRSMSLVNQLAAMYQAAGRSQDASQLWSKSISTTSNDPMNLLSLARTLSASQKHDEATDAFIKAIRSSPAMFDNGYNFVRNSLSKNRNIEKLATAMVEIGLDQFQQSFRVQEVARTLATSRSGEQVLEKFIIAALDTGDWNVVSSIFSRSAPGGIQWKMSDDLAEKIADKLCDPNFSAMNVRYLYSTNSDGGATGFISGLVKSLEEKPDELKRVRESLETRVEAKPDDLFGRIVLATVVARQAEYDKVLVVLEPLLSKKTKDSNTSQALWVLASDLVEKDASPKTTQAILSSFGSLDMKAFGFGGSRRGGPQTLLIKALQNLGDNEAARRGLIEMVQTYEVDTSMDKYNPGYSDGQFVSDMYQLSRQLLEVDAPVEAFVTLRKGFADPKRVESGSRYMGVASRSRDDHERKIAEKLTDDLVMKAIDLTLSSDDSLSAQFLRSIEVSGNSMADARLNLPLAEFLKSIEGNKDIRDRLKVWLDEFKVREDASLRTLVCLQIVKNQIDETNDSLDVVEKVSAWVESHPPPEAFPQGETEPVEQELLLAVAADHLPSDPKFNDLAKICIERATRAAEHVRYENVMFGLQCQLARRVANSDVDRARQLYLNALNGLFPLAGSSKEVKP